MGLSVQTLGVGLLNWRVKQQILYGAPEVQNTSACT